MVKEMYYKIINRYKLKDDVRQSLYDECNKWTTAIGKHRRYMGGDKPNLADLVRYQLMIGNSYSFIFIFH